MLRWGPRVIGGGAFTDSIQALRPNLGLGSVWTRMEEKGRQKNGKKRKRGHLKKKQSATIILTLGRHPVRRFSFSKATILSPLPHSFAASNKTPSFFILMFLFFKKNKSTRNNSG